MTPISRRPSSSSLRRLWLPMKAAVPSRMIARTCSRRSGSLRASMPVGALSELAEHADLDARLGALREQAQHQAVADLRVVDEQFLLRLLDEVGRGSRARSPG